jgi:hypothetical protein
VCDRDGSRPELVFCAVPVQGVPQTPAEDGRLEWACLILLAGGLGFEPRLTESELVDPYVYCFSLHRMVAKKP